MAAVVRQCVESGKYASSSIGRLRPDIVPELHYFAVEKYLILYRAAPDGLQIIRVIHGARVLPNKF